MGNWTGNGYERPEMQEHMALIEQRKLMEEKYLPFMKYDKNGNLMTGPSTRELEAEDLFRNKLQRREAAEQRVMDKIISEEFSNG